MSTPPSHPRWAGIAALAALAAVVVIAGVRGALLDTGAGNALEFAGGLVVGAVVAILAWLAVRGLRALLASMPAILVTGFGAAFIAILVFDAWSAAEMLRGLLDTESWAWPIARPTGLDVTSVALVVLAVGLLAGSIVALREPARGKGPTALFGMAVLVTAAAGWVVFELAREGEDPFPLAPSSVSNADVSASGITLPDPAAPGRHAVETRTYGAGDNPRRPDFGDGRHLESRTVDATKILPEWKGIKAEMRERYWGFGLDAAPLNGTIYAPEGNGPFPLALIVHGNHGMEDYSDGGYAYLGELLASRGIIAVSVDQNSINGSWSGDFRGKEMAARAWLLLEHLALWRDWNRDKDHPFGKRVDLERIALIGHSRGGEAVSIAHAFNNLPAFPDDATVPFDYSFGIRSLVAIAQVDQRYHRRVQLEDVNFLALQGSYDADEPAFHGLRQFNRIDLSGDGFFVKAGLYIHGANHGQFNTTWGRYDFGRPGAWLLNTAPIIAAENQQAIAAAYVSAFLEATLNDKPDYLALLRDPSAGADWLPAEGYVQQYRDSTFKPLATFDDDLDVATGTAEGVRIRASDVGLWREEPLEHRDRRLQGTHAVVLGWNADATAPTYTIDVPQDYWTDVNEDDYLSLSITASTEKPPAGEDDSDAKGDAEDTSDDDPAPPVFEIAAELGNGGINVVASDEVADLAPPYRVRYLKHAGNNKDQYNADWEPVLQYIEFPLARFAGDAPVSSIRRISLRFADMPEGVVILDDIGVRRSRQGASETQ